MRLSSSAARPACVGVIGAVLTAFGSASYAAPLHERACGRIDYNAMILDIIKSLPTGGGYSLSARTVQLPTVTAHNIGGGRWEMRSYDGFPSYCSSATYAVFAHLATELHNSGRITLRPDQMHSLKVLKRNPDGTARADGQGPFAIFNSNGAGVAAFLKHTGTGFSFRDDALAHARPGDFLKLFWNKKVGATERGHQAIFTGRRVVDGRDMVCFWSSQKQRKKKRAGKREPLYFPASAGGVVQNGYGEVCRPRTDIKAMVFSRLTCMKNLTFGLDEMALKAAPRGGLADLFVDEYLYSIRTTSSDHATLDRMYGILPQAVPAPVPATFADSGIAPLR